MQLYLNNGLSLLSIKEKPLISFYCAKNGVLIFRRSEFHAKKSVYFLYEKPLLERKTIVW